MSLLDIRTFPDQVLKQKCSPLEEVTASDAKILSNMVLTMHHCNGIGLAAPQVGILKRLFVADIGEGVIKIANPEIINKKGTDKMKEGCLSLPDIEVEVERPFEIIIIGLDENNKEVELKTNGLLAKVIQHEVDHLNGKLIIDHLNIIEKLKILYKSKEKREITDGCQNII